MKILLTSLMGLSSIAGGIAPSIMNLNNADKNVNLIQKVDTQASETVNLGQRISIVTENSEKSFQINFSWTRGSAWPSKLEFLDTDLESFLVWGNDQWKHSWSYINLIPDGNEHDIFREQYNDGWADARIVITYKLEMQDNKGSLTIKSFTMADASFSTAWGNTKVGPRLRFSN